MRYWIFRIQTTDKKYALVDWLNDFWVDLLLRHIWMESSEVVGLTNESIVLCGSPLLSINETYYFNASNKFSFCKDKNYKHRRMELLSCPEVKCTIHTHYSRLPVTSFQYTHTETWQKAKSIRKKLRFKLRCSVDDLKLKCQFRAEMK